MCVCVGCGGGAGLTLVAWLRSYEESDDNTGVKMVFGIKVLLRLLISTITSNISFIPLSSLSCLQCFRDIRRLVW